MKRDDPFFEKRLNSLVKSLYFFPLVGIIPGVLTQMNPGTSSKASSLSLKIHAFWAISYIMLWVSGLQGTETLAFRLLYLNTIVTSGYILTCCFLVFKTWRDKK